MPLTERELAEVTTRFDQAIYSLRDSDLPSIPAIAGETVDRFRRREISLVLKNPEFNIPTVTGFDLALVSSKTQRTIYAPVIVADPGKILAYPKELVQADLVRTVAVASQYPLNGFERRLSQVYRDALSRQKEWLIQLEERRIELDPRFDSERELLLSLLGEADFYTGVGFTDWIKGVEIVAHQSNTERERKVLETIAEDRGHFIATRRRLIPMLHQTAINVMGRKNYFALDEQERAEAAGVALVGISVYARDDNSN